MITVDETSVLALWRAYCGALPGAPNLPVPPASAFGDSPELIGELFALVSAGTKRATAALELEYAEEGEPVPAVGDHWISVDASGRARVVLRTTEIRIGVLNSVDDAFAWDEGEDDRTRRSWLQGHRRYFGRVLARRAESGAEPVDLETLAVVFERFAVVWPPELITDADRAAVPTPHP